MIHNDLLRKAVRVEYTLLRTPLVVLDERVVPRSVPGGAVVHTSLTRTISVLDTVAERLLSEPAAAAEPSADVAAVPDSVPADAPSAAAAGEAEPMPEEEREDVEQLAEDLLEAEEEQTFAGELAADEELRRVQAELRAKHTIEEHTVEEHTVEEREESP